MGSPPFSFSSRNNWKLGVNPVRVAGWLTDFIIEVRLESLRKKYPEKKREELVDILRRILSERDRNEL
ncbi:MAG: hypothetical protein Q6352_019625 [Candidatus Freyrarchaeum guaymaensis]